MSISKEIFGIEKQEEYYPILSGSILNPKNSNYIEGFNDALKEIDEFELSEEALVLLISEHHSGTYGEGLRIAKAIKSNQSKLFVRKNNV